MTSSIYPITVVPDAFGTVTSVTVTEGGSGYTSNPVVVFTGGGGTGAAGSVTLASGVTSYTVSVGGTGYVIATPPTVTVTGGGGTGATAVAVVDGAVTGVSVSNGGSNYTTLTTVSFSGGGGTGATAIVDSGNGVLTAGQFTITNGGTGYTSPPTVIIHDVVGGGAGAVVTSLITTFVTAVNSTADGTGFTSAPSVVIAPPSSGVTAVAAGVISNYVLLVGVTNPGTGYSSNPAVTFTGGGGTGAAATASVLLLIDASTNILLTDLAITGDLVSPGGGAILRLSFAFTFGTSPATVGIFNNGTLKGNLNADNSTNLITNGYYRFDLDVESGDSINLQASESITAIRFIRAHLAQFGA